jgi:glucose-6-phosphate 1-dehydrogenase
VITRFVVLGVGDVTTRYLLPALAELAAAGELPDDFEIVAAGRGDHDTAWLRDAAAEAFASHTDLEGPPVDRVLSALAYLRADATDPEALAPLFEVSGPVAIYLALPSTVFADAVDAICEAGVPRGSRLAIEKPFGTDAASAAALNDALLRRFAEQDVFRVDHFLGMRTTLDICTLRFSSSVLGPVWGSPHVERVEVVWDETLALEGRAAYYEGTGALRDMLQNHLLQLMCIVAMEPPDRFEPDCVADRKVEVLRSARPWNGDAASSGRRARYTAGHVDGEPIPAYVDENGVEADSCTETFAEIVLRLDSPRWQGVPFVLRSGKALADDRHEVVIHFRPGGEEVLRVTVDPDTVALGIPMSAGREDDPRVVRELLCELGPAELGPYAHLLREFLRGDPGFSVRGDEAVAAWQVVEPFLRAWEQDESPLLEYRAGSQGPEGRVPLDGAQTST